MRPDPVGFTDEPQAPLSTGTLAGMFWLAVAVVTLRYSTLVGDVAVWALDTLAR